MSPPSSLPGVLIRRGKFGHRDTDTQGIRLCEDRGEVWNDVSGSQRATGMAGNHLKMEEAKKDFFLEPSEGTWLCQHLDEISSLQNVERVSFCCFKAPSLWYFIIVAPGNEFTD